MPQFSYKARDIKGSLITDTIEAENYQNALRVIRQKNVFPFEVKEVTQGREIKLNISRVKLKDLAIFCRQFATLLNAGIAIATSIEILQKQTTNTKLKTTLEEIHEDVLKGKTFSDSMRTHSVFPDILINMIEAGEVSGTLDRIMERMAVYFEKENNTNQKVRAALTYPAIVSFVAMCVVFFLVSYVLPTFISMFTNSGVQLPLPTKILLVISYILSHFWYYIIAIIGLWIFFLYKYVNTPVGRATFDMIKLRIPVIGNVYKKVIASRFTRTLGILLASGIPVIKAMQVVEKVVGNVYVTNGLKKAEDGMRQGRGMAKSLDEIGIFQPMVIQMIAVGEESGMLDNLLDKTSNFFDQEVDTAVSQMTTMLEPAIIVVLAVVVGFIVVSIMMPMFQMYSTIKY